MQRITAALAGMKRDDLAKAITKLAASSTLGCDEVLKALESPPVEGVAAEIAVASGKPRKKWNGAESLDFSRYRSRYVALHVMYLGHNYHGLASQVSAPDTIEAFLFDALIKRCLIESREKSSYSRCGRTDKGVSAFSQIIALRLRSKARTAGTLDKSTKITLASDEEFPSPSEEIDYPVVINSGLPQDIRVLGWCDMPETFSARFNARHRTYRYFFPKRTLDIDAMREGAEFLLGRHDFRNLCKIDVMHVDNFERVVYSARIEKMYGASAVGDSEHEMYYFEVCGTAFLWHQVRCMMAVLFLIGKRLEAPDVISKLLDVSSLAGKPSYDMAPDIPLMLYGCEYESLNFHRSANMLTKVVSDLEAQWSRHSIIAAQIRTALDAINGYRVVGASEPCGGPTLGKTAGAVTLITTDHMPFDVAFRGGKSVVEVAAGAGAESVEAVGAPPLETGAITTAAWLSDAGLKPDISCEYPLAGTYVPLLKRKTAPSVAAKLSSLSEAKKRKRQEDHPNFYSDDDGES